MGNSYRIIQDDCIEAMGTLDAGSVDCCVTSPPYNTLGSRIPAKQTGIQHMAGFIKNVRSVGYADDMEESDYADWLVSVAAEVARVIRPGGSFFFNHKVRSRERLAVHPYDYVRRFVGFSLRQEIIWDRGCAYVFNARMFPPCDERIYWMVRDGAPHDWNQEMASVATTIWRGLGNGTSDEHPCPFPDDIPRRCIRAVRRDGMVVLDPFTGSGSTGVAAIEEGCSFVGIEREAEYVKIAEARLAHASKAPMFDFTAPKTKDETTQPLPFAEVSRG